MSNTRAVAVSALLNYAKGKLENDPLLQNVLVVGEISNFSSYRSGHWYFSLKDAAAQIRCVMFASSNRRTGFLPKDGDRVIVRGDISVYTARGDLQFIVSAMKPDGIGDLYLQYEALKKKLSAEGLFDESRKKPVPKWPFSIALVTGRNTAARSDVLTTLKRRWPCAEITEYPVLVQGKESAAQIASALTACDKNDHDVILLVRGGGSIEDLWSFNDEQLARVISRLETPLITGVGHETDFTIADFVADLRAPTPTGAAERCSPDIREVRKHIADLKNALVSETDDRLEKESQRLERIRNRKYFRSPERLAADRIMRLHTISLRLNRQIDVQKLELKRKLEHFEKQLKDSAGNSIHTYQRDIEAYEASLMLQTDRIMKRSAERLGRNAALLDAYSPLKVLMRGYSIAFHDGTAVKEISQVKEGDTLSVRVSDGRIETRVEKTMKEDQA